MSIHPSLQNSEGHIIPSLKPLFTKYNHLWLLSYCKSGTIPVAIIDNVHIGNVVTEQTASNLYARAQNSLVGRGSQTVFDESVRSSREFTSFKLDDCFLKLVKENVAMMLKKLGGGKLLKLHPHKIVIYGPGDGFDEHIDSRHIDEQNMTCVVELDSLYECEDGLNSALRIEGDIVDPPDAEEISIFLFYNDVPHKVVSIRIGYRISITFDVVASQNLTQKIENFDNTKFEEDMKNVHDTGARRIGFFTTHRYLSNDRLKGSDAAVAKVLEPYVSSQKLINLKIYDDYWHSFDGWIVDEQVYQIIEIAPGFKELLEEAYNFEEEDNNKMHRVALPDKFEPKLDIDGTFEAIKDKYRLGDVLVLWVPHKPKLILEGAEEIHLGNEGFFGKIYENGFLVFDLK